MAAAATRLLAQQTGKELTGRAETKTGARAYARIPYALSLAVYFGHSGSGFQNHRTNKETTALTPTVTRIWSSHPQKDAGKPNTQKKDAGGDRNEVMGAVGSGSAALPRGTNAEINEGGLHEADPFPSTENRFKNSRSGLDLPDPGNNSQTARSGYQIFVKTPKGTTSVIWTYDGDRVSDLKNKIADQTDYPGEEQHLLNKGRSLQDCRTMQEYNIKPGSTIILNMRIRGGAENAGTSSQNKGSFKEAVKGKGKNSTAVNEPPGQYIVDQLPESPSISIEIPEVKEIHSDLQKKAVICRFNGFWPRTDALYQWIYSAWTKNCQIYLYPKGFFIVCFESEEEMETVLNQGPWFWGSAGLFIVPWFPDFDTNTMVVSRMPVWVRLHNLPLHFWHSKVLIAIGNTLGRILRIDGDRYMKGIFTFARICVEVDLSRGLPESIILNFNNTQWKQPLDYENTAFRCRGCQQTGHLYNACPNQNKSKHQQRKPKGWQNIDAVYKKATTAKKEEQNSAKEKDQDNKDKEIIEEKEQETQMETGGNKRSHSPEGSDSDKEQPMCAMENQLAVLDSPPNMDGWRKVEKKKGRKT